MPPPQTASQPSPPPEGAGQGRGFPPARRFEEWGYAERAWYVEGRQGITGAIRALLWPTDGVVEVGEHDQLWAARTPQPPADLFRFLLSEEGYQRLHQYLSSTMTSQEPVSRIGESRFYPARRSYHLFHTCHQYIASALREAGLPIFPPLALSRTLLAMQLHRAVRLAADPNIAEQRPAQPGSHER